MELIQPFINAADAVFAESLNAPTKIGDLSMEENTYRRKGVAALIAIKGDIEGRIILDLAPEVAVKVASVLAGSEVALANKLFAKPFASSRIWSSEIPSRFSMTRATNSKFLPPEIHMNEEGLGGSHDTEAMVISIETPCGEIFLNIAMRHLARRRAERDAAPVVS